MGSEEKKYRKPLAVRTRTYLNLVRHSLIKAFYLASLVFLLAAIAVTCVLLLSYGHEDQVLLSKGDVQYRWVYESRGDDVSEGSDRVDSLDYMHMGMLGALPNGSIATFFQGSEQFFEGSKE